MIRTQHIHMSSMYEWETSRSVPVNAPSKQRLLDFPADTRCHKQHGQLIRNSTPSMEAASHAGTLDNVQLIEDRLDWGLSKI